MISRLTASRDVKACCLPAWVAGGLPSLLLDTIDAQTTCHKLAYYFPRGFRKQTSSSDALFASFPSAKTTPHLHHTRTQSTMNQNRSRYHAVNKSHSRPALLTSTEARKYFSNLRGASAADRRRDLKTVCSLLLTAQPSPPPENLNLSKICALLTTINGSPKPQILAGLRAMGRRYLAAVKAHAINPHFSPRCAHQHSTQTQDQARPWKRSHISCAATTRVRRGNGVAHVKKWLRKSKNYVLLAELGFEWVSLASPGYINLYRKTQPRRDITD